MTTGAVVASRYRLKRGLGTGSFGETWLAEDLWVGGRPCALKILKEARHGRDVEREFETLRSLYHTHIVEVLSFGVTAEKPPLPYLVTEFIDGRPFDRAAAPMKGGSLAELIAQVCRALSYLHDRGIVHGDLTPSNILVQRGNPVVKLIDFGLAVAQKARGRRELPAGTPATMAPEVIREGHRTKKSDLYAWGLILYQLFNRGRLPFSQRTESIIHFHLNETPSFGFLQNHPWQKALEPILTGLLEKNPSRRPNDALEIVTTLNEALGLSLQVGRGETAPGEESILYQKIRDYIEETAPIFQISAAQGPQSFFREESTRIEKYLEMAGHLSREEREERQDLTERLQEMQCRILIQQGQYREVLRREGRSPRIRNVRALAQIYLEDFEAAERALRDVREKAEDPVDRARAANHLGLAAYNRGLLDQAHAAFEQSLSEAESLKEVSLVVAGAMNLAAIAQQQAKIAEALKYYRRAHAAARDLKNSFLLSGLLSNMANLLLQSGSLEEATRYLERSEGLARELDLKFVHGYNLLLKADIAMWRKDAALADRRLEEAVSVFEPLKSPQYLALTRVSLAENAYRFRRAVFPERLQAARKAVQTSSLPETGFRLEVLSLLDDIFRNPEEPTLAGRIESLADRARNNRQRFSTIWVRASWALKRNDLVAADRFLAEMEELYEKERESLPIAYRSALAEAPRFAPLWDLQQRLREAQAAPADRSLWQLVEINKRIASQRDSKPLCESILDAAIELTGAERGFLILGESTDGKPASWKVRAARRFRQRDLPGGKDLLSRTIVNRLLSRGKPLLIQNALEEDDWVGFRSVRALRLRSILATPVVAYGQTLGILYVDHCKTSDLFGQKDLRLLKAFADQAGIVLSNTRLYEETARQKEQLEATRKKLEETNLKLEQELRDASSWAVRMEDELRKSQEAGRLIARSVAMRQIVKRIPTLAKLRRPVVLTGEPGTGKDLLTRTLHQVAGVGPYVLCLASRMPRQKTTGDDPKAMTRLLEEARGGTLYVDEVTELPIPFQRDLLQLDPSVFLVLSSRQPLKKGLEDGLILPDLHRSLAGSEVRIPPLRERKEDIGPLAHHFLKDLSAKRGIERQIGRKALALLHQYGWPGNVRELELEIERAAITSHLMIGPYELSPQIVQETGFVPGGAAKEERNIRGKKAQFERDLVLQTLESAGWNKARAAKMLGLSRTMLYLKLRKYQIPLG